METYHWILVALVAVCAVWIARQTGFIDRNTAILGTIGAIATSILGQKFTQSDQSGETTGDPRDEPVDDIPVDDKIDSPSDIEREHSHEDHQDDGDPFDRANNFSSDTDS